MPLVATCSQLVYVTITRCLPKIVSSCNEAAVLQTSYFSACLLLAACLVPDACLPLAAYPISFCMPTTCCMPHQLLHAPPVAACPPLAACPTSCCMPTACCMPHQLLRAHLLLHAPPVAACPLATNWSMLFQLLHAHQFVLVMFRFIHAYC